MSAALTAGRSSLVKEAVDCAMGVVETGGSVASRHPARTSPAGRLGGCFGRCCLPTWHDIPDVRLAEARDDCASFRRFCGFSTPDPTPERAPFVRFRGELVRRGLDRALFAAAPRPRDARGVVVRTGTLVDATLIPSPNTKNEQARWARHRHLGPPW